MPTKQETDYIPTKQYKQIAELMPIASVEASSQNKPISLQTQITPDKKVES